jgi:hypothetical protein
MVERISMFLYYIPFVMLLTSILLGAVIGLAARDKKVMAYAMIRYIMLLGIGASCLWEFVMGLFFPSKMALALGTVQSPFMWEVAFANLGLALAGIWAFKGTFDSWVTVAIMATCFNAGTALLYLWRIGMCNASAPFGHLFYADILTIFVLNMLLCYVRVLERERGILS